MSYYRFTPHAVDDRAFWMAARAEPRHAPLWDWVDARVKDAPAYPPLPHATDYKAATRSNDRGRTDRFWSQTRAVLSALMLHRLVEGTGDLENDPDDRLLDWFWGLLTHPTWAVAAHLPGRDLPLTRTPTLDLAACEMAAFMAEARETLKPWMDHVSDTLADTVLHEIDQRVLKPYAEGVQVWWQSDDNERLNNWLGVCAGSILAACESLAAQGHPRPEARARALEGLKTFFWRGFTDDGECDEGVGYWNYGMGFACLGLCRLELDELDEHIDLARLRRVADYPLRAHLFDNYFFSGNDGGLTGAAPRYFVPWLAKVTGLNGLEEYARHYPSYGIKNLCDAMRQLAAPDLGAKKSPRLVTQHQKTPQFLQDQQVAILRTPTSMGELVACLSGGHNGERHNHNDLGQFLIFHAEQPIVIDLGAPRYMSDFFGPRRYEYLSASSLGHCCPVINGVAQRDGREAAGEVLEWQPQGEKPRLKLDLTAAYPPEAKLEKWIRTLELRPGAAGAPAQMVIRDEIKTAVPGVTVLQKMWLLVKPFEDAQHGEGGGVRMKLGTVFCEIVPSPSVVAKDEVDPESLLLRQFQGQKLHELAPLFRTDDQGELLTELRFYNAGR